MPDFPTFDDLREVGRRAMLLSQPDLTIDAVDREGTDAGAFLDAAASIGDVVIGVFAEHWSGLWLESAKGAKLDKLIYDRYRVARQPASVAYGSVEFRTATPAAAAFTIPEGAIGKATDGRQYRTVESKTYPLGSVGPISVRIVSVLAGAAQQARANTITSFGAIPGAPADLVVTNTVATAGAADAESNEELIERARASRGADVAIMDAIVKKALAFPGVKTAVAYESLTAAGYPTGVNTLIITDRYTESLATLTEAVPSYEVQSQALASAVYESLKRTRSCGVHIMVMVAVVRVLPISLSLTLGANATDATVQRARAAVVNYTNSGASGRRWVRQEAIRAMQGIPGLIVTGNDIAYPPGDVVPSPLEALRTDLALVTTNPYA